MPPSCYNEAMDLLLPGYPVDNPVLAGLMAIAQGEDLELALARRDAVIGSPASMVTAVFEALAWLPVDSFLLPDLLAQGARAWGQLNVLEQAAFANAWAAQPSLPPHCQAAVDQWIPTAP